MKRISHKKSSLISAARCELILAMSSLNMTPNPQEPKCKDDRDFYYLSEVDGRAEHSMKHMKETYAFINEVELYIQELNNKILHIRLKMLDMQQKHEKEITELKEKLW